MMKTKELVEEYNQLTGNNITRFANREEAEKKVMDARKESLNPKKKSVVVKEKPVEAKEKHTITDVSKMFENLATAQAEFDHLTSQLFEAKKVVDTYSLELKKVGETIQELKGKILPSALKQFGIGVKQTRTTKTRAPKEHLKVKANGTTYRSVAAAFKELELPKEDILKVRNVLKKTGQYTYNDTIFTVVKE
jgi:hypothetical protein